jgi:hypothetical protein
MRDASLGLFRYLSVTYLSGKSPDWKHMWKVHVEREVSIQRPLLLLPLLVKHLSISTIGLHDDYDLTKYRS